MIPRRKKWSAKNNNNNNNNPVHFTLNKDKECIMINVDGDPFI